MLVGERVGVVSGLRGVIWGSLGKGAPNSTRFRPRGGPRTPSARTARQPGLRTRGRGHTEKKRAENESPPEWLGSRSGSREA